MQKRFWLGALALVAIGCGGSSDNDSNGDSGGSIPSVTAVGVTDDNRVLTFDSNDPGNPTRDLRIDWPDADGDQQVTAIDVQPSTGALYALAQSGALYTLDANTGVATRVGSGNAKIPDSPIDIDFNPTAGGDGNGRIRVASDVTSRVINQTVNPITTTNSPDFTYSTPAGQDGTVVGVAYTFVTPSETATRQFGIDAELDAVVLIDIPTQALTLIGGGLGIDIGNENTPMDISEDNSVVLMSVRSGSRSRIYAVDLATGTATRGRLTPNNRELVGLAITRTVGTL